MKRYSPLAPPPYRIKSPVDNYLLDDLYETHKWSGKVLSKLNLPRTPILYHFGTWLGLHNLSPELVDPVAAGNDLLSTTDFGQTIYARQYGKPLGFPGAIPRVPNCILIAAHQNGKTDALEIVTALHAHKTALDKKNVFVATYAASSSIGVAGTFNVLTAPLYHEVTLFREPGQPDEGRRIGVDAPGLPERMTGGNLFVAAVSNPSSEPGPAVNNFVDYFHTTTYGSYLESSIDSASGSAFTSEVQEILATWSKRFASFRMNVYFILGPEGSFVSTSPTSDTFALVDAYQSRASQVSDYGVEFKGFYDHFAGDSRVADVVGDIKAWLDTLN